MLFLDVKKLTILLILLAIVILLAGVWLYFIWLCSYPDACGYWNFDNNFQPPNVTQSSIICQIDNECIFKDKPYCCGNNVEYYKGCYGLNEEPAELNCEGYGSCPQISESAKCVCIDSKCTGSN